MDYKRPSKEEMQRAVEIARASGNDGLANYLRNLQVHRDLITEGDVLGIKNFLADASKASLVSYIDSVLEHGRN